MLKIDVRVTLQTKIYLSQCVDFNCNTCKTSFCDSCWISSYRQPVTHRNSVRGKKAYGVLKIEWQPCSCNDSTKIIFLKGPRK
jgi:hypothetical protein